MSVYELEIGWADTANLRRFLRWELVACDAVRGVFLTACDDVLAVLFTGTRSQFDDWVARRLTTACTSDQHTTDTTNPKGALQ